MDIVEKITSKIDFPADRDPDQCWVWPQGASRTTTGVPRVKFKRAWVPVRRALYEHHIGPIPTSELVRQPNIRMTCGNPDCVNPHHAYVLTDFDRLVTRHERDVYRFVTEKTPEGRTVIKQRYRKRAAIAAKLAKAELGREPTQAEFKAAFYASLPDDLNPYILADQDIEFRRHRDPLAVRIAGRDFLEAFKALGQDVITPDDITAVTAWLHGDLNGTRSGF